MGDGRSALRLPDLSDTAGAIGFVGIIGTGLEKAHE